MPFVYRHNQYMFYYYQFSFLLYDRIYGNRTQYALCVRALQNRIQIPQTFSAFRFFVCIIHSTLAVILSVFWYAPMSVLVHYIFHTFFAQIYAVSRTNNINLKCIHNTRNVSCWSRLDFHFSMSHFFSFFYPPFTISVRSLCVWMCARECCARLPFRERFPNATLPYILAIFSASHDSQQHQFCFTSISSIQYILCILNVQCSQSPNHIQTQLIPIAGRSLFGGSTRLTDPFSALQLYYATIFLILIFYSPNCTFRLYVVMVAMLLHQYIYVYMCVLAVSTRFCISWI